MKFRYLTIQLFVILVVHYSSGQAPDLDPALSNEPGRVPSVGSNLFGGLNSQNTGLADRIRNTTSNIIQRLEGPRDRIVQLLRPAVQSDFSRNVTNVLNSIWGRVQESNSTIIRNPLFRNVIVIPINTTLSRLREVTGLQKDGAGLGSSGNLEVIDLSRAEDEQHLREYLRSSSSASESATNAPVIFLVREDEKVDNQPAASENNEESSQPKPVDQPEVHDEVNNSDVRENDNKPIDQSNNAAQPPKVIENPTKSIGREARFLDRNYNTYVTPDKMRNSEDSLSLFGRIKRKGDRNCIARALCQIGCRSHLYNSESLHSRFRSLFEGAAASPDFKPNDDMKYYLEAQNVGRRNYDERDMKPCGACRRDYHCDFDVQSVLSDYV